MYHLQKQNQAVGDAGGRVSFKTLCKEVAQKCGWKNYQVELVINKANQMISDNLIYGYSVEMGGFGNFRVNANCKGVKRNEFIMFPEMNNPHVIFLPGKLLRSLLEEIRLVE